jgi:Protein of unknown function (DUF2840).
MIGVADPSLRTGLPPAPAADALTHVELTWVEKKIEFWIRFGREIAEQILDRRRRVVSFAPDSVFAFVRWTSNDYGTALSRLDIVRAVGAGERCQTCHSCAPAATSCCAPMAGRRSSACSSSSMRSRRGASKRSTFRPITGDTSTTV